MPSFPKYLRAEPTPFARLELIRHGLGDDFKFAGDLGGIIEFANQEECDVIPKNKKGEVKLDRLAVIIELRKLIRDLTGLKLEELVQEANNGTSGFDPEHRILKEKIRAQISNLPFFNRFSPENKDIGFQDLSREANDLFDKLRSNRCYRNHPDLDMLNEIRNCDDPAKLLLFVFDNRVSDNRPETKEYRKRKRFEAARKLFAMLDIAAAKSHVEPKVNHKNALEELTDFLYKHMIYPDQLTPQYLVADCDEKGKALDAYFVDNLDNTDPNIVNRRIQKFLARTMRQDRDGEPVRTITDDRIKKATDLVLKAYDANSDIASRDVDRNGQLFIFKSRAEWEHFFEGFVRELKENILTNTQKRLAQNSVANDLKAGLEQLESLQKAKLVQVRWENEDGSPGDVYGMCLTNNGESTEILSKNPEAFFSNLAAKAGKATYSETYEKEKETIDDTIVIYQVKDNLEGEGEFNASREAGSAELAVLKFKIEIRGSDEKREIRHYEIQIYLPKGYADSKFSLSASHESYSIKRAIKVGRVYWPEDIYNVDHELAKHNAFNDLMKEKGFVKVKVGSDKEAANDISDAAEAAE